MSPNPKSSTGGGGAPAPRGLTDTLSTTRALATLVATQAQLAGAQYEIASLRDRVAQHEAEREALWRRQEGVERRMRALEAAQGRGPKAAALAGRTSPPLGGPGGINGAEAKEGTCSGCVVC
jgi:hypothetical protein